MSAPLSEAEAAPLKLLLGAKSKGIVDKIVSEVFKQLHAPLDKRALIEQSLEQALSLAAADAYEEKKKKKKKKGKLNFFLFFERASLHTALRQFVSVALRVANASGGAIDAS
jgi:hypothetical protein